MVAGAVYKPLLETDPIAGLRLHSIVGLPLKLTVNCWA